MEPVDILAIGAHPDDVEIGMGGTIIKHTQLGYKVGIIDLTKGELGTNGTAEIRLQEGKKAMEILRCSFRHNLGLPDGQVLHNKENVAKLVEVIRKTTPKVIFAPYYQDKHPDHVACGKIAEESYFASNLRKYLPSMPPHHIKKMAFYAVNPYITPSFIIDISEVYALKRQAVLAHSSQFFQSQDSFSTELNRENGYPDRLSVRDKYLGHQIGVSYGEGFIIKSPVPLDNVMGAWGIK